MPVMKVERSSPRRALLVVTETSPVDRLWRALLDDLADAQAEVVAVFLSDDRWTRAASLPFTREISRLSGGSEVFTARRAQQVVGDLVDRARQQIQQLAEDRQFQLVFEILHAQEPQRIREFVRIEHDVLIAPSMLQHWPDFADLARPERRVVLVDDEEPACPTGPQ
jgi:hypothetical protein